MGLSDGVLKEYSGVDVAVPNNFLPHSVLFSDRPISTSTIITVQNESPGDGALGLSLPFGFSAIINYWNLLDRLTSTSIY